MNEIFYQKIDFFSTIFLAQNFLAAAVPWLANARCLRTVGYRRHHSIDGADISFPVNSLAVNNLL